jgi:structural maintenance of chromosome 3 (chondroitin sulfate proteoglycan 6)
VGKNGSGKSSFLKAIIWVLSDRFSALSKQQKRGMLNNIAQQSNASEQRKKSRNPHSADPNTYWVEITLDNSEHRIPFNSSEIVIKK